MFINNVGDMPLDIFCDYIQDTIGEEWIFEYFAPITNGANYPRTMTRGFGYAINNTGDDYSRGTIGYGNGYGNDIMQEYVGGDGLNHGSGEVFFGTNDMIF
jgi:hypothetical protein